MIDIIELEGKQGNLYRKLNMAGGKDCSSNQSCSITKQIYIYIGFKNSKKKLQLGKKHYVRLFNSKSFIILHNSSFVINVIRI